MGIERKIQSESVRSAKIFNCDPAFIKLESFYKDALEKGYAKKAEYSLPPLDIIGRNLSQQFYLNEKNEDNK